MGVTHLLDYGSGHNCSLAKSLKCDHKVTYQPYDPCVPRFSGEPAPAQMVASIDVLEHIEPESLDNVLDDIQRLCDGIVFLTFYTKEALKTLADGRNAHLIQKPIQWWLPKLWDRWELQTVQMVADATYIVIGNAMPKLEAKDGAKIL